ncbi:hypothetical protein MUK42_21708, partial [Musa troglodytarum]
MVLCIGNGVICHSLHIRSQLFHGAKLGSINDGMWRDKAFDIRCPKVDGHCTGIKCIVELLGDVAVRLGVFNGEDKLVMRHGTVYVPPPGLFGDQLHFALGVEGKCCVTTPYIVHATSKRMMGDVGKNLLGKFVSEPETPRRRPVDKDVLRRFG